MSFENQIKYKPIKANVTFLSRDPNKGKRMSTKS